MIYSVDRLEGAFAVCEDSEGAYVRIGISELPDGVRSGDVLVSRDGKFYVDKIAADKRRAEISALQDKLLGRGTE